MQFCNNVHPPLPTLSDRAVLLAAHILSEHRRSSACSNPYLSANESLLGVIPQLRLLSGNHRPIRR
jgi:hypothetical protein